MLAYPYRQDMLTTNTFLIMILFKVTKKINNKERKYV